jgi:hypothetical protein
MSAVKPASNRESFTPPLTRSHKAPTNDRAGLKRPDFQNVGGTVDRILVSQPALNGRSLPPNAISYRGLRHVTGRWHLVLVGNRARIVSASSLRLN